MGFGGYFIIRGERFNSVLLDDRLVMFGKIVECVDFFFVFWATKFLDDLLTIMR